VATSVAESSSASVPSTASGAVAPVPELRDPNELYTDSVKNALIDAMLRYSSFLKIGENEWLTVAASDSDGPQIPGQLDDASRIVIRVKGSDLVLTIDRYVQRVAERLLNQAVVDTKSSGGLILVMEPQTGNILAAANNPTYDLTADQIYNPAQVDRYRAKIVTDQYEPGSTLKTIAMSAAIDQGVVTPGTTINDTGVAHVDESTIHNWNGAANGISTMTEVLIHSSNVGMTLVSGMLGPGRMYDYYTRYGFGQPTGLRLPGESSGKMRTNQDPGWSRVDLATNAYGQGIAMTPVQLLQAVAVFANQGQLVRPRLLPSPTRSAPHASPSGEGRSSVHGRNHGTGARSRAWPNEERLLLGDRLRRPRPQR